MVAVAETVIAQPVREAIRARLVVFPGDHLAGSGHDEARFVAFGYCMGCGINRESPLAAGFDVRWLGNEVAGAQIQPRTITVRRPACRPKHAPIATSTLRRIRNTRAYPACRALKPRNN